MCGKVTGFLLIVFAIGVMANLPPMDEEIGEKIFQENKIYLVYVCDYIQDTVVATLNEFCTEEKLCTIMSPEVELYEKLREFIGMPVEQYLLILDVPNRSKYTLPIPDKGLTLSEIDEFYTKFHKGEWERYLTSEAIPTSQPDPYLQKLVGLNFKDWLSGSALVKVVYLYTADELCDNCFKIYKIVADIAKKYVGDKDIVFGHFDLFKNEHILLKEENVPFVLIYENGSLEPIRLEPSLIHTLEDEIARIMAGKKEDDL